MPLDHWQKNISKTSKTHIWPIGMRCFSLYAFLFCQQTCQWFVWRNVRFCLLCSIRAVSVPPFQSAILWFFLRLGDTKMQIISAILKLWSLGSLWPPSPACVFFLTSWQPFHVLHVFIIALTVLSGLLFWYPIPDLWWLIIIFCFLLMDDTGILDACYLIFILTGQGEIEYLRNCWSPGIITHNSL